MRQRTKKLIALLLATAMCFSSVSTTAFAEEMVVETADTTMEEATSDQWESEGKSREFTDTEATDLEDFKKENNQEAEEESNNGWDGTTKESEYKGDGFKVTFTLTGIWNDGYNAGIRIENTSGKKIENWRLAFAYAGNITNIWNGVISEHEGSQYIIKNATWNQDIVSGSSVEFEISGQESFLGFPTDYELLGTFASVAKEDYTIEYQLNNDWGSGFTGTIFITNNTEITLEDWLLEFDFDRNITSIWNGEIESHEDNHYLIYNAGHNANIAAGQTISFGFGGNSGMKTDEPVNYALISSVLDNTEVTLNINTDEFLYNEAVDWYVVKDEVYSLSGTLTGAKTVKSLTYKITDYNGTVVKDGKIEVAENWTLEGFGLSVGYNELVITVVKKSGEKEETTIAFSNSNLANLNRTNVDLTDTDGDGLCNYYEILLGTDTDRADTDGDQLTDYEEFLYVGTDPTLKDTDGNGIIDSEEDLDKDGLSNLIEIKLGTKCLMEDTDGDGLFDGDEVNVYITDPLTWDTDGDGLSDSQDIELKFDPTLKDTDGDGINDGEEKVYQTFKQQIENEDKAGILSVEVGLECSGYLGDNAAIIDTYNIDMRSSEVVGMIGIPIEVSVDAEFTSADIIFTYDENALGDTSENDLAMMWYDEENDRYVVLDSVVNTENNTVTYTTTHFSTYLIIDKQIWLDDMRMDINYRNSGEVTYYDMALVVDVSGSMSGTRIATAKTALNKFVDAMMDNDRAGLVKFASSATKLLGLTNSKTELKSKVSSLSAGGGTNADAGILEGISVLDSSEDNKEKMLILVCDGDVSYVASTVSTAVEKGIIIHCINVVSGSSTAMQKIANETGGIYYYAATTADVAKVIEELAGDTVGTIDMTDTDGDGLYDVYETNGMRLSNGQIVYTDPNNPDTDGDGINDYDAMGGEPVTETFMLDGNTYSCTLNHSKVYGKLSSEFIYVDGTLNSDGKQYYGEMSYLPYSNAYLEDKYSKSNSYYMFGESRSFEGAAGIHNLFLDKKSELTSGQLAKYKSFSALVTLGIGLSTLDPIAMDVFNTYTDGTGGDGKGWVDGYTRKTIDVSNYILNPVSNSAYDHFITNIFKTKKIVEGVLNEYNQEIYISTSPNTQWCGCAYVDYNNITISDVGDVLCNTAAFGTFNSADAGITAHCTYDPDTETYTMEYSYYLIDFYDYSFLDLLQDQDALGLTRSYELYGKMYRYVTWKKGDTSMRILKIV